MVKPENNVLLVSFYFAPNQLVGAKRISYLSYYLSKLGYKVSVLTIKQKYNPQLDEAQLNSGEIHRVLMIPSYPVKKKTILHTIYKRIWEKVYLIDPYVGWILPAIIRGIKIIKKNYVNSIIASGPPFNSFFIAYFLSWITQVKFIIDYRDPWFLYNNKDKFQKKINLWLEELILKKAYKVVFNTDRARKEYLKRRKIKGLSEKSIVIRNAVPFSNEVEPFILEKNKKVILYAGNFYGKRSLEYLIEPLQRLFNEGVLKPDNVAIHVFGKVPEKDKNLLSEADLLYLLFEHSKVNSDDIIRYMKGADILYLPQGEDVKYSIAFKFYDYLSAKKPILAVTSKDSAMAEIMQEIDCGEIADINDSDEVYTALKKILIQQKTYNFSGRENYSWEKISSRFSALLKDFN